MNNRVSTSRTASEKPEKKPDTIAEPPTNSANLKSEDDTPSLRYGSNKAVDSRQSIVHSSSKARAELRTDKPIVLTDPADFRKARTGDAWQLNTERYTIEKIHPSKEWIHYVTNSVGAKKILAFHPKSVAKALLKAVRGKPNLLQGRVLSDSVLELEPAGDETLQDMILHGTFSRISFEDRLQMAIDLMIAYKTIYDSKYILFDIHPKNILVGRSGIHWIATIIDFDESSPNIDFKPYQRAMLAQMSSLANQILFDRRNKFNFQTFGDLVTQLEQLKTENTAEDQIKRSEVRRELAKYEVQVTRYATNDRGSAFDRAGGRTSREGRIRQGKLHKALKQQSQPSLLETFTPPRSSINYQKQNITDNKNNTPHNKNRQVESLRVESVAADHGGYVDGDNAQKYFSRVFSLFLSESQHAREGIIQVNNNQEKFNLKSNTNGTIIVSFEELAGNEKYKKQIEKLVTGAGKSKLKILIVAPKFDLRIQAEKAVKELFPGTDIFGESSGENHIQLLTSEGISGELSIERAFNRAVEEARRELRIRGLTNRIIPIGKFDVLNKLADSKVFKIISGERAIEAALLLMSREGQIDLHSFADEKGIIQAAEFIDQLRNATLVGRYA